MPVPSNDTVLKMNTEIDNAKYSIIYAYKMRLCETEYCGQRVSFLRVKVCRYSVMKIILVSINLICISSLTNRNL